MLVLQSANAKLSDSHASALDQCGETPENTLERKKRRVLKQYERNMKKTHKVSCFLMVYALLGCLRFCSFSVL